ncbi:MAG: adenylyltransferase/cytidyltransferase family protein [Prevotella sp.]|nr:adenylyltransferase/cytidyltransferase family protein [Prevotella sp.]
MKKYKIGYTQGVYDMFHIGHLNIINRAKEQCDYLIVGVNSDELVKDYKHKETVIKEKERATIIENLKAVDQCIIVNTLDKELILEKVHFNAIFIGDDWYGNPRWMETKEKLAQHNVDVVFLPHTEGVSSTILREKNDQNVKDE